MKVKTEIKRQLKSQGTPRITNIPAESGTRASQGPQREEERLVLWSWSSDVQREARTVIQQPSDLVSPFSAFQKGCCRLVRHRNAYSVHRLRYRKTDNHSYLEKQKFHRTEPSMSFNKKSFVEIPLEPGMGMYLSVGSSSERGEVVKVSPDGYIFSIAFPYAF